MSVFQQSIRFLIIIILQCVIVVQLQHNTELSNQILEKLEEVEILCYTLETY